MAENVQNMKRMKELVALLNRASKAYYNDNTEIMSNYEYDCNKMQYLTVSNINDYHTYSISNKYCLP